jgi:hypothetical protein
MVLIDLELGIAVAIHPDGASESSYRILSLGAERAYRLAVVAGSREYVRRAGGALADVPAVVTLDPNAPNPFNPSTRIRFGLPRPSRVSLAIYDVRGRCVTELLASGWRPAGYHSAIWDGRDRHGEPAASGVYYYRLASDLGMLTGHMVLLR